MTIYPVYSEIVKALYLTIKIFLYFYIIIFPTNRFMPADLAKVAVFTAVDLAGGRDRLPRAKGRAALGAKDSQARPRLAEVSRR